MGVTSGRRGGMPQAPNMGPGINHAENLRESAPARVTPSGQGNQALVGVRATSGTDTAGSGKAVTGVAATDLFTAAAHGYVRGDRVKFTALTGGAGITPTSQIYWVIASGLTINDFRVSLTPDGPTIDFTTDLTVGTVTKWTVIPGSYAGTTNPGPRTRRRHPIAGPRTAGR